MAFSNAGDVDARGGLSPDPGASRSSAWVRDGYGIRAEVAKVNTAESGCEGDEGDLTVSRNLRRSAVPASSTQLKESRVPILIVDAVKNCDTRVRSVRLSPTG
jgi:hypothetical protein